VFLVSFAGDGHDFCVREGWHLAQAQHEATAVHVGHYQIDQHQIGPKCGGRF
jgi:hypothetical protein